MGLGTLPRVRVAHVHNPWLHITANYATSSRRMATAKMGKFLTERLATHVLGTSGDALARYGFQVGSRAPHVAVLHCGFDVTTFSGPRESDRASVLEEFGWTQDARIVLFAGRLDRALEIDHPQNHKNSWLALNAMRAALAGNPNLRLVMAGAGEARDDLQAHLKSWGLESQFRLVGVRQDLPRLLRAADLLFFPSRQEGLGMVAVEAQAAGVPVLTSDGVPVAAKVVPQLYHTLKLGSRRRPSRRRIFPSARRRTNSCACTALRHDPGARHRSGREPLGIGEGASGSAGWPARYGDRRMLSAQYLAGAGTGAAEYHDISLLHLRFAQ